MWQIFKCKFFHILGSANVCQSTCAEHRKCKVSNSITISAPKEGHGSATGTEPEGKKVNQVWQRISFPVQVLQPNGSWTRRHRWPLSIQQQSLFPFFFNPIMLTEEASEEIQSNSRSFPLRSWRSETNPIKQVNPGLTVLSSVPLKIRSRDPQLQLGFENNILQSQWRLLIKYINTVYYNVLVANFQNRLRRKVLPLFIFHAVLQYNIKR